MCGNVNHMEKQSNAKKKYVIIRAAQAGCFAGELHRHAGDCVTLHNARRLWYWAGAASLSQLATTGTSKPEQCKFPIAVASQEILGVIEILDVTAAARASIEAVSVWSE